LLRARFRLRHRLARGVAAEMLRVFGAPLSTASSRCARPRHEGPPHDNGRRSPDRLPLVL